MLLLASNHNDGLSSRLVEPRSQPAKEAADIGSEVNNAQIV